MNIQIILVLACFVFIGWALMTNKMPGAIATAMAVLILWLCKILTMEEAFANFVGSSILSVIFMQIVARGLMKTDILRVIATSVTRMKGGIYVLLFASMFVTSLMVSFVGSQITAVITILPLVMGLAEYANIKPTVLVYPAVIGAQCTLFPIPMGSSAVMYLQQNQILELFGAEGNMNMWDAKLVAFIPSIAAMIFVLVYGWKLLPARDLADSSMLENGGMTKLEASTLPKWKQYAMYAIFVGTVVLFIFARQLGINAVQISMGAAFLTYILGILDTREWFGAINWQLIGMMGFMLAFIAAVSNSGAADYLAKLVQPVFGTGNLWLCCAAVYVFCIVVTQFMDNMGLINIIQPIVVAAAVANGIPAAPVFLAVSASAVVSYVTPMGSPAGLFAYQLGGYKIKEMLKFAIPVVIVTTIVACIWIPFYWTTFRM